MKHRKFEIISKTLLILFLTFLLQPVFAVEIADNVTIRGNVKDESGEPVIGATISIMNGRSATQSDENGDFTITTRQEKNIRLSITAIGFTSHIEEIKDLSSTKLYQIVLRENTIGLSEVVVTGYSQTLRNSRTSAVSEIKSENMENIGGTSFNEQIQGQAAGLLISGSSGTPGSSMLVRLRGATSINAGNDPLYIVDGVPIGGKSLQAVSVGGQSTNPLSDLNPSDIESIQILKDANATAMYGSRGANGVILITTKKGGYNSKTRVSLNVEYGFANAAKKWDLLTGPQHATIVNEAWVNDGNDPTLVPFRSKESGGLGTPEEQQTYDRQDAVFRSAALQNYNLSISGGDKKTTFYVGGEYTSQDAIIKTQDFERASFRVNLEHKITERLLIGTSNSLSYTNRSLSKTANTTKGILQAAVHNPVFLAPYDENGNYLRYGIFENVYALIDNSDHKAKGLRNINNVYAKWNILNNLSFKSSFGTDLNTYKEKVYYNTNLSDGQPDGRAIHSTTSENTITAEQVLNYYTTFKEKNFLSIFLGNTLQKTGWERDSIAGIGFPSNSIKEISAAAVTSGRTTSSSNGLISYFGGFNYSFDSKYSLDANVRIDGSSRFGKSHRWGYFPSFGSSWRLSEEGFIKNHSKFIDDLRLKASIGWTGNQEIGDFLSRELWSGEGYYGNQAGIVQQQLANPDLKWETTRQWNIGIDGAFFNRRLTFEFNYYNKYTYDLLLNSPLPAKTGFTSTIQNVGEMSNKGVELEISSVNIRNSDFEWTTNFNISHNKNMIEKLPTPIGQYANDRIRLEEGYPMYSFWLYKQLYVDPETGNAVYDDSQTGDGMITSDDRQIVGDAWPDFIGGLRNNFKYKGFDLSVFFYFSVGNDVFNMNRFFQEHGGARGSNWSLTGTQWNRWQKPGDITDVPKASTVANADGSYNNNFHSSRFVEDGSFLRLRNLSLGYTFPKKTTLKAHIERLRVYVNATNLWLWTKYTGADPESNVAADNSNGASNGMVQGLDFGVPPQPRQFVFGVNITF